MCNKKTDKNLTCSSHAREIVTPCYIVSCCRGDLQDQANVMPSLFAMGCITLG